MANYVKHVAKLMTPQGVWVKSDQKVNHADGYAFVLDLWARFDRG